MRSQPRHAANLDRMQTTGRLAQHRCNAVVNFHERCKASCIGRVRQHWQYRWLNDSAASEAPPGSHARRLRPRDRRSTAPTAPVWRPSMVYSFLSRLMSASA